MLIEVKRHGFSFWEAPHRIGPAFEAPYPRRVRRLKALARFLKGDSGPLRDMHGKPAKPVTGDLTDPKVWGELVQLSDSAEPESIESKVVGAEFNPEGNQHLIADIQKRVRAAFGVTWRAFMKGDATEAVWARTASMALCRGNIEGVTAEEIGRAHGWRGHAAVVRAVKRCEELRRMSGKFAAALAGVEMGMLKEAA